MKVEINDTLQENVNNAIEEVRELIENRWSEEERKLLTNHEAYDALEWDGRIHEIVDGCVPIYTKELKDTWYLYENELIEACENHGLGTNLHENNGMVAIYCYIMDKVMEWMQGEPWADIEDVEEESDV